ncbi:ATP-binding protein [Flavobacterium sp.]|uniref:tetratricopeptide repeat-containing sensor histidine kinase n=1 Tax=Flavobacterium sp. TaxID=239 RepID=UPI003751163C
MISTLMRIAIALLTLLLVSCNNTNTTNTTNTNDSIKKFLAIAKNDTLDFKTRDKYNEKAFNLLDLSKNDSVLRNNLSKITLYTNKTFDKKNFNKYSLIFFKKSFESKDTLNLARCYRYKASYLKKNGIYDSAFYYFLKSEKFYKFTTNYLELSRLYIYTALLLYKLDDNIGADYYITKSKLFYDKQNKKDLNHEYNILNEKGNILHNLKNYNLAISYHNQALKIVRSNKLIGYNNTNLIGTSYNNIGNSYTGTREFEKAIYYFKEGLKEKNILKNHPELNGILLNNLGFSILQTKDNKSAITYLNKAEIILNNYNFFSESAQNSIYKSDYYFKLKDTLNAKLFADKALIIARKSKSPYTILNSLVQVGFVNKEKASKSIKEYDSKIDSLIDKERIARNQFYNIQLQTNEITKDKEKAIKQKWVLTSIIASVLLIVILLFIIYRQKAKQKEILLLQDQQKANVAIYELMINQQKTIDNEKNNEKKRIAKELHDNILNKLASTRFNLFELSKKTDKKTIDKALLQIDDIKDIENEIRNISHNLNQDAFIETHNFQTLITTLIQEQSNLHQIKYTVEIIPSLNWELISSKIKMQLYRIIQEALHNIYKHAQATHATVNFEQEENSICMSIKDNGFGFNTNEARNGIGIKNMQERIESNNGKFSLQSNIGAGTSIFIILPF